MSQSLKGKRIIITGGFGTLGKAVAHVLGERQAQVALLDLAPAPTQWQGSRDLLLLGDVDLGSPASASAALAEVVEVFGGVDALINVAGGFAWETFEAGDLETWDRLYSLNLRTALVSTRAALPYLLENQGARVINIGAQCGVKGAAGMGAYAASKSGVARFTESLAEELKDRGLTVNAVLPSIIDTPQNRQDMPSADFTRWVAPHSLAAVIAFLLGEDAADINGACLPVSGRV